MAWYVSGPLTGLFVPALLLLGNRMFGISSDLRHVCAVAIPGRVPFVRYDCRSTGAWSLSFAFGVFVGRFIAVHFLGAGDTIQMSAAARAGVRTRPVTDPLTLVTRPRIRWEMLAWIAMALFIGLRIWPQLAAAFGVSSANAAAPSFELTTLDGQSLTSERLRGKVVLVNVWATWCPPCRIEMPGFQAVYDRKRSQGFVVLGISTDAGGSDGVRAFLVAHHITYPVAMASASVVRDFGGASVLPTSFLIDRQGRIRNEVRGAFASFALEPAVDHLLAESPAPAGAGHSQPQGAP